MDLLVSRLMGRVTGLDWPSDVSRPDIENGYQEYLVTPETAASFGPRFGITIHAAPGTRNLLMIDRRFTKVRTRLAVHFTGSRNIVLIEEGAGISGVISCLADCVAVVMGHQHQAVVLDAQLYQQGELFWGRHARTFGCTVQAHGGKRVVVGDDCMFSARIILRTSDFHSIISLDDYTQQNFPADVTLERHVWLSPDVHVMRGVRIGKGAIIGANSIVTKSVPAAELWAGVPAKRLKQNVSWVESHPAGGGQLAALRRLFAAESSPPQALLVQPGDAETGLSHGFGGEKSSAEQGGI